MQFEPYLMKDGLASNMVYAITDDKEGYLWIGTANGLNRFDGSVFQLMYYKDADSPISESSLSSNKVKALISDAGGNIWVGTQGGGLNRIDHDTKRIRHYIHDPEDSTSLIHNEVLALLEGPDGNIWIGTENGLSILEIATGKFYNYYVDKANPLGIYAPSILNLSLDDKKNIWFGTWGGTVQRIKRGKGPWNLAQLQFERFYHKDMENNYPYDEAVWGLKVDKKGRIWAGTFGNGIVVRGSDASSDSWHRFSLEQSRKLGIMVFSIFEDTKGRIWVATGEGMSIIEMPDSVSGDLSTQLAEAKIQYIRYLPGIDHGFPSNQVRDIHLAQNGIIWIAFEGGLAKFDPSISLFESYLYAEGGDEPIGVGAICKDPLGYIWVGTWNDGLIRVDEQTGERKIFGRGSDKGKMSFLGQIKALFSRKNQLWIGTENGVSIMNIQDFSVKNYPLKNHQTHHTTAIYDLDQGPDGYIFAASYEGLVRINPSDMEYKFFRHDPQDPLSLPDNRINDILFESDSVLWAGMEQHGLVKINYNKEGNVRCKQYLSVPDDPQSLLNKNFVSIAADKERVWIGSSQGLQWMDRRTEKFSVAAMNEGLPNLNVQGLQFDENGLLWISTNPGIARYNPELNRFTIFGKSNGLKSTNHYDGGEFMDENGVMYYGGNNGYTKFTPGKIRSTYTPPAVELNGLRLANKKVMVMEEDPELGKPILSKSLSELSEITLSYKHKVISLDFSIINYQFTENCRIAFKLEGLEKDWRYADFIRSWTYTSLDPGTYFSKLKLPTMKGFGIRILLY